MSAVIRRLESDTEQKRVQFREGFGAFAARHELAGWEGWYSPHDEETYSAVLSYITPDDVVLEIGAGDLRLALRMAERARRVYAAEVNPLVVGPALEAIGLRLPRNLHVMCANAFDVPFPPGVTVAVLLMRHCQHFGQYFDRLQAAGCQRLLTNARWKSGVEVVDLTAPRTPFEQVRDGWYTCRCGAVGYVGDGARVDAPPVEVAACPACSPLGPDVSSQYCGAEISLHSRIRDELPQVGRRAVLLTAVGSDSKSDLLFEKIRPDDMENMK